MFSPYILFRHIHLHRLIECVEHMAVEEYDSCHVIPLLIYDFGSWKISLGLADKLPQSVLVSFRGAR